MNTEDSSHDMCIWINDEEEFNTEWSRLQGPASVCSPPPPIRTQPAYSILFFRVFSPLCLSSVLTPSPRRVDHATQSEPKYPGLGFLALVGFISSTGPCRELTVSLTVFIFLAGPGEELTAS